MSGREGAWNPSDIQFGQTGLSQSEHKDMGSRGAGILGVITCLRQLAPHKKRFPSARRNTLSSWPIFRTITK